MIKMIVTDLDGTLLNRDGKVSNASKEYLKNLKEKGYIIVVATGRMYASACDALDDFSYINYCITDSGVTCYDVSSGICMFSNPISVKVAKKFKKYYNENSLYIDICDKNTIYKYSNEFDGRKNVVTTKDWDYIFNNCREITHITMDMKTNEQVKELYNTLKEENPELDINIMQDSFGEKIWIDILNGGSNKFNAISKLATYLNIRDDEIIAFGDGLNDIDMLKKCGVGVSLSNALLSVKENANFITEYDHNNDGVIKFLQNFLK